MDPMDRMYGSTDEWRAGTRLFGPHGEYVSSPFHRAGRGFAHGGYDRPYEREFGAAYDREQHQSHEHVWHGGVLGWLGSGLRAGAGWIGEQMQSWGALLGGKLQRKSEELGREMRGRGERVGSAMEQRGDEMMRAPQFQRFQGRPPRSYRRPDDRILDDVHQRVAMSAVDADDVEIAVSDGVVTISGRVPRGFDRRLIEEIAEQVFGVEEVKNNLRIARRVEERPPTGEGVAAGGNGHGSTYRPGLEAT